MNLAEPKTSDLKRDVESATARLGNEIVTFSRRIYEHPELSGEEYMAHEWCADILLEHGFKVEQVEGVETAFVATLAGSVQGPTIGLLAEYDALPGVGHACGHHLIAGAAIGAGLALAECRNSLPGVIKIFGCPAEEIGSGKAAMLDAGVFEGTGAALTFHAHDVASVLTKSTAIHELRLHFRGKASHAATEPWAGASALDGVLLTYQNVNALRQFVRDGVRIHGIVSQGGDAFNIVPERASCQLVVRCSDPVELARVVQRVTDCARAAALASQTEITIEDGMMVDSVLVNTRLADVVRRNLDEICGDSEDWNLLGSTDFANVSRVIPSVLFTIQTWPSGTVFHTHEASTRAGEEMAYKAMLDAARVMALSAVDLCVSPELLTAAHASGPSPE